MRKCALTKRAQIAETRPNYASVMGRMTPKNSEGEIAPMVSERLRSPMASGRLRPSRRQPSRPQCPRPGRTGRARAKASRARRRPRVERRSLRTRRESYARVPSRGTFRAPPLSRRSRSRTRRPSCGHGPCAFRNVVLERGHSQLGCLRDAFRAKRAPRNWCSRAARESRQHGASWGRPDG
jgi:hypothetical protein